MDKRWLLTTGLMLGGCAAILPMSSRAMLVLRPQIVAGTVTKAVVNPYDRSAINHLVLKLYTLPEADTGLAKTLSNAQLDNPVVFSNLKPNTSYRVKAFAYLTGDDTTLISSNDASSSTDIVLTNDDRPTLTTLAVKLIDRSFNAQATGSLAINSGGYAPVASEGIGFSYVVTTIAGDGTASFLDGAGLYAKFNAPHGLAVDAQGNIFVADHQNHRIRKISPAGGVSTFAGNGNATFADGTGTSAMFNRPNGMAIDAAGNLFVADQMNHRVRKVTPAGVVSTLAGNGAASFAEGNGVQAMFNTPTGVAVDVAGNVFVADYMNNRIRKIATNGDVTTFAGNGGTGFADGQGTAAMINGPHGIATDPAGNVYVAEGWGARIRKISAAGLVSTLAGNGATGFADGIGTNTMMNYPHGILVDSQGNIIFVDRGNARIRKLFPDGTLVTLAGAGTGYADGTGTTALFSTPTGIALDAKGNLYVGDSVNQRIRRMQ